MNGYPERMKDLIDELSRLPGIGSRTAERLAFHILAQDKASAERLASAVTDVNATIHHCSQCFNLSQDDLCGICSDGARLRDSICVVEEPKDIISVEKAGAFKGLYRRSPIWSS